MRKGECSAYVPFGICLNGFPTNAACIGATCPTCNRLTDKVPACMREDYFDPRFMDDAGRMRLASPPHSTRVSRGSKT